MDPDTAHSEARPVKNWLVVQLATLRDELRTDGLLHHGGLVATATIVSGAFNYAYQLFMGRALGPEQFGVFGALFALFYLVNVLGRGIRFSATRFTAEYSHRDPAVTRYFHGMLLRAAAFSIVVFAGLAVVSPGVSRFLGVESPLLVLLAVSAVPAGLTLTANQGAFQGLQWFWPLSIYKVLLAVVKLALGVSLVSLGFGLYGAFGAVVIATLFVLAVSTTHLQWRLPNRGRSLPEMEFRRAYRYMPPAIVAGFCISVPGTVDVIIVQHAHPGTQAGLYAAVAVLGKILIFLPLGLCVALFPKVSRDHAVADGGELSGLLMRGLLYAGGIAAAGALLYAMLPELVLGLFFGADYVAAAALLRWYGVAILAFSLAVVILNFELARDRTRFVYLFAVVSVVEIGLIGVVSTSLVGIVQIILLVNAGLFGVGLFEVRQ